MKSAVIVFVSVLIGFSSCTIQKENFHQTTFVQNDSMPYLVVLSMDGFRWDYPDTFPTPNLNKVRAQGLRAKSIIPSFPTITFPNHYTLATGLYPENHGIVHNDFYNPLLNATFNPADARFYLGEPIWVTAQKQQMMTANYFWIGSNVPIQGMHPTYWKKCVGTNTFEQRIDTVVYWLSLPSDVRPHLIMFYMEEPDLTGHSYGPFSSKTRSMVMRLDSLVGDLLDKTKSLPISNRLNFVFTSDHGMENVNQNNEIFLNQYIKSNWYIRTTGGSPSLMIDPVPGYTDSIISHLSKVPHLSVWKKSDVPGCLHFNTNPNIGQIVVLADSTYLINWSDFVKEAGSHGYDNRNTDMHAIFYAMGPAFQNGIFPSFRNVDFYPLMSYILKLSPVKTDGDFEEVRLMVK